MRATSKRKATGLERKRPPVLEGIARGERAVQQGRVMSHAEAKKRLARWLVE